MPGLVEFAFTALISTNVLTGNQVEFYEDYQFQGGLIWQGPTKPSYGCTNLPRRGQSLAASLVTNVCIMAYPFTDCQENSPSFSIPPGRYANLSVIAHHRHFQNANKTLRSFRECKEDEGNSKFIHVELKTGWNELLVEYHNVLGCTNIPYYCFGAVTKVNNHGNCILLYAREDCTGNMVKLTGGVSRESEDLSDIAFDGQTRSIKGCSGGH